MLWLYFGCLFIGTVTAQVPFLGGCPQVNTVQDFNTQKYLGKWYEAERYFAIFEFGGKCVTATYDTNANGSVSIVNKQISSFSGVASSIKGFATQRASDRAKLGVIFPSLPVQFEAPYWILDTDYTSYAVVWSCSDYGIVSSRNAWILTRERNPPVSVLEKAYQVVDKNKISRAFFVRTDQKNCVEAAETNHVA